MNLSVFSLTSRGRRLGLLCVALALVVHAQALKGEPILDDQAVFLDNPAVQGPLSMDTLFSSNIFGGKPGYEKAGGYRPLTLLTFRLGPSESVWFQRLLNLLFHALTVWMVWLLAIELGFKEWTAAFGTSVFAVHPVHVDAIVPLNNRSDLLCTFLLLASVLCWLKARDRRLGLAAVAFGFLAAMSKEQGLLAPFYLALPTLVWWRRFKLDGGRERVVSWRWAFVGVSLGLSLLVLYLRTQALGGSLTGVIPPSDNPLVQADLSGRVLAPGVYLLKAVHLLVFPLDLSADYTRDVLAPPSDWSSMVGWAGLLLFAFWVWLAARQVWLGRMMSALCLCGSLMAYLVTSNLVILSTISFSERALYLPSAFLTLALCALIARVSGGDSVARKLGLVFTGLLLFTLCGLSLLGVENYRSNASVARFSILSTPRSARMHTLWGENMMDQSKPIKAQLAFNKALEFDPGSAHAYRGLGTVHFSLGQHLEAAKMHDQAIVHSRGGMIGAYNDGCLAYLRSSDYGKALKRCHAGLLRAPKEALLMTNAARAYLAQGKLDEAIHWARLGHQQAPDQFYPLWHLLLVTMKTGDRQAAESLWKKVKKLKPGDEKLSKFARQFGFE